MNKMKTYALKRTVYIDAKSTEEHYQDTEMEVVEDDN